MFSTNAPPITVGVSDSNGALGQLLGQQYIYRSGTASTNAQPATSLRVFKLVKNNSGTTLAAGAAVIEQRTLGVPNGNVTTTTTANNPDFAGVVPHEFGTATVASGDYFLLQVGGPARPQFALTTTLNTLSSMLGTATTAGYLQPLIGTATGTAAATLQDVQAYIESGAGIATNTAAVTAAGQLGYADLRLRL